MKLLCAMRAALGLAHMDSFSHGCIVYNRLRNDRRSRESLTAFIEGELTHNIQSLQNASTITEERETAKI